MRFSSKQTGRGNWAAARAGAALTTLLLGVASVAAVSSSAAPPDKQSSLSVNDVVVAEGDVGTTNATFTVTLSPAATKTVTVDYTTIANTATAGADYQSASGTLVFSRGQTSKQVAVNVIGDTADESNETFVLRLSKASNAVIGRGSGQATIIDDDEAAPPPPPPPARTLTVSKAGNGTGSVTSSPAGIDCGSDCSESYADGTSVTLTATPAAGSTFSGWSGACTGIGTCTVAMDADKNVTATFAANSTTNHYTLTVTATRTSIFASGVVTSNPAGIDCSTSGGDCTETYPAGTTVTLTAAPSSSAFSQGCVVWSGDASGTENTTTVLMNFDRAVTATFGLTNPFNGGCF